MPRPRRKSTRSLTLQPADPFDLIRWLARSQSDPRKAVAELVQNSLDAGARHVTVSRVRHKGALCLLVRDDGEGVLPALAREDALRHLATHVGHSHKLGLDPSERMRRVVAGKYGVGLLGFWAIGHVMELRSRVAGSALVVLELEEDSPRADLYATAPATDAPDTFTEVVVRQVHDSAQRMLGGRRLSDYLAAELRGQLLTRDVQLVVHDGVARGTAQKRFEVKPRRYQGERLELPAEVEVTGFGPMRVELYLARGSERPTVQIACAGTLVADDIAELSALGLAEPPWVSRELSGLIDFAGFSVPPGTRRGVMPDRAAAAFVMAMEQLAPRVLAELERYDQQRHAEAARDVVRELRRALRGLGRRLPQYELPRVPGEGEPSSASGAAVARPTAAEQEGHAGNATDSADATDDGDPTRPSSTQAELFPPGPLAVVRVVPPAIRLAPGTEHRVRAVTSDAALRRITGATLRWHFAQPATGIELRGEGARPAVYAAPDVVLGTEVELRVEATEGPHAVTASARIVVAEPVFDEAAALGIPEPVLVSDQNASWRSRMQGERWEINDAHEDYRALRAEPRARLRYLLMLLGKELVSRAQGYEHGHALEALVEVLAHAERNLRGA